MVRQGEGTGEVLERLASLYEKEENWRGLAQIEEQRLSLQTEENKTEGEEEAILRKLVEIYEEKLSSINVKFSDISPAQEVMLLTLIKSINFSLKNKLSPEVIAKQCLNIKGHPIVEELRSFLQTLSTKTKKEEIEIIDNNITEDKDKCKSCGATQLRQNGTCKLCEVCGETTGCS